MAALSDPRFVIPLLLSVTLATLALVRGYRRGDGLGYLAAFVGCAFAFGALLGVLGYTLLGFSLVGRVSRSHRNVPESGREVERLTSSSRFYRVLLGVARKWRPEAAALLSALAYATCLGALIYVLTALGIVPGKTRGRRGPSDCCESPLRSRYLLRASQSRRA